MPVARFDMGNGKIGRFEVPEGTTPEAAQSLIQSHLSEQQPVLPNMPDAQAMATQDYADPDGLANIQIDGFTQKPQANPLQAAFEDKKSVSRPAYAFRDILADNQPVDNGLTGRIAQDYVARANKAENITNLENSGQLGGTEATIYRGLNAAAFPIDATGQLIKTVASPVGSAINWTADTFTPNLKGAIKDGYSAVAASPIGEMASNAVQGFQDYRQNHPVASARIGGAVDLGNIAAAFAPVGKGKSVAGSTLESSAKTITNTGKSALESALPNVADGTLKLAQRAQDFGIPLKISQISDSKPAKILNAVTEQLPFSGAQGFEQTQQSAFNRAVAKTLGQDADNLGPETINAFRASNSQKYSSALEGHDVSFHSGFNEDINSVVNKAKKSIDPGLYSVVKDNADDLIKSVSEGTIQGDKVNSIRSELLDRAASADGPVKNFLNDMVEHIDDAVADSLPAEKYNLLKEASREYRNFKTLEPLLEKSVDGNISPALINQRVAASKFIKASRSSVGNDDLVDLGRIGQKFLKQQIPDSGTAGRVAYTKGLLQGGGTIGSAAVSIPGTAAGLAAGRGLQAINRSQKLVNKSISKAESKAALQKAFEAKKLLKKGK